MNKRLLIALIGLVLIVGVSLAFVFFNNTFSGTSESTTEGDVTKRGVITCLPKIGDGPHTLECALGLQSTEGAHYGLRGLSDHDEKFTLVSPDIQVEITGNLIHEDMFGPDGNRYDTAGIIEIKSISEI
jgi:hypothetical protein